MENSTRPIETFRDGRLKAAIFENHNDRGTYHSIKIAKVYETKDGDLKETNSFSSGELLRVAELARESHQYVRDLRRERTPEKSQDQTPARFK